MEFLLVGAVLFLSFVSGLALASGMLAMRRR